LRGRVPHRQLQRGAGCTVFCTAFRLHTCWVKGCGQAGRGRGDMAARRAQVEPEMQLETEEEAVFKPMALDDLW